jgi:ketosteroid isomerase-like protein
VQARTLTPYCRYHVRSLKRNAKKNMRYTLWFLCVCSQLATAGNCAGSQLKNEAALIQIEQSWAQALEKKDSAKLDCILADEFQDADPYGKLHGKPEALVSAAHRRPLKNQLSQLNPHVYGDFGYIRGLNTLLDADGKAVARVRFTDIFSYRAGRWQALAGHETLVTDPPK